MRQRQPGSRACGSEAHGGWRQFLAFVVVGRWSMAFIGWRIVVQRPQPRDRPLTPEQDRSPVDAEEFRPRGHELIDWIADYIEGIERQPVAPDVRARRRARPAPRAPAGDARAVRRRARRPRRRDRARPRPTGSTRASSPTSRPTRRTRRSSASCSSAGLGVQGMSWVTVAGVHRGRDARCSTGWSSCSTCPSTFRSTSADRRRRDPGLGQRGDAGGDPGGTLAGHGGRGQPRRRHVAARRLRHRRRRTRASRRACASPASAPTAIRIVPHDDVVRHATRPRSPR